MADATNRGESSFIKIFSAPDLFACDEVAEVLDKNRLSKEDKELVTQIEGKLSIISRQGRAFGIHLILATQRPDNVLSQSILDSTEAADRIPKDAQGWFMPYDGTVFQGYLFDENKAFEKNRERGNI